MSTSGQSIPRIPIAKRLIDFSLFARCRRPRQSGGPAPPSIDGGAEGLGGEVSAREQAYFLDLRLTAADGSELASSFYWLSIQEDVLDWDASEWFVTPISRYADLTALTRLPPVELEVEHRFEPADGGRAVHVTLRNPGGHIAFFVALEVVGANSGGLAAPILWDDNYVSLLPGESREIHGTFPDHALEGEEPVLRVSGMNVK
jgi:exo-1,4-beta-D-glucosaminidase